jgi:hypothetical protein
MIHKRIVLTSILILCAFGLDAQNDFRKMNWYESSETLMEKYPEVEFQKETEMGMTAYSHIHYVSGIETRIAYCFMNDEFVAGVYEFTSDRSRYYAKDFVKDFDKISDVLQSKYEMKRDSLWYTDTYSVDIMGIDYYLEKGDVDLGEVGFDGGTSIVHTLANKEDSIKHILIYSSRKLLLEYKDSLEDDF